MNKFLNLKKTIQIAISAALVWAIWSVLPSVDRWNGAAGIALYFVGLLAGIFTLGLILAPARNNSKLSGEILINRYGECLEKSDHLFRDVRELPASKDEIGDAILLSMAATRDEQALNALGVGFVELSRFQLLTPRQSRAVRIYSADSGTEPAELMKNPKIASEILAEVAPLLEQDAQEREIRAARLAELEALVMSSKTSYP